MPIIARLIGGAGTGKTTELMRIMTKNLETGVRDPTKIGFCSFTRAARREAAERAADQFGYRLKDLEEDGWFKTLHAICYRCLGAGKELLAGSKADAKWIEEAIDQPVGGTGDSDAVLADTAFEASTEAAMAMRLWDAARNRLEGIERLHALAEECDERTPPIEFVRGVIDRYEQAKRLDGRYDFVDLLGRFAGWKFTADGVEQKSPEGYVPALPVWLLDEQQDTSPLLDSVCHRLIEPADWVYVVGDPFQAIYGWAGADPKLFQGWPVAKQKIMPKSYRCGREVLEFGEDILREASDYWDRGIAPADHESTVERERYTASLLDEVDPRETWLLIARTNFHAQRLAAGMRARGIPWVPTKGNGGWNAPARNEGIQTLLSLEKGLSIPGGGWKRAIEQLPASLLVRGTKTEWEKKKTEDADREFFNEGLGISPDALPGGTEDLAAAIHSKAWRGMVPHAEEYAEAVEQWGEEAVRKPRVQVGTIHSVKGMEATNVLWLTSTSAPCVRAAESEEGFDEECRVSYVAATRARKRLIVAVELNTKHRTQLP